MEQAKLMSGFLARYRERRRRALGPNDGYVASLEKGKGSPYQKDGDPLGSKRMSYSGPELPEDIWQHIHSLLPMRDAARAACVSHAFLRSWRCHPNLTFSAASAEMMCLFRTTKDFTILVDHVMKNHSGIGINALTIDFIDLYNPKACNYLDSWLHTSVAPGIRELTLLLCQPDEKKYYNFPCSLLSNGSGSSIRLLHLYYCNFHPTAEPGCFGSLTVLHLESVRITGDELGCLLSNSFALERLKLKYICEIICLKIPCVLKQLSYLEVIECPGLQVIENEAPNLRSLCFVAYYAVQFSFGESLLVKNLVMRFRSALYYASVELSSTFPNLETLTIDLGEMAYRKMSSGKLLHLKHLHITLSLAALSPSYDYCSLIFFLDASPSLETFNLDVPTKQREYDSVFGDPTRLRQMPEHRHDNLRSVKITRFYSMKGLVELTCHIIENTSVQCLTLDTNQGNCLASTIGRCFPIRKEFRREAPKALIAIKTYIEAKVPSTVNFNVVKPCSRCLDVEP